VTPYIHPFALLLAFEYVLDCLKNQRVGSLNYSVGLWVLYRCEGDLHPDLVRKILEHGTIEIVGIIDSDLLRNSIAIDDALPEEFLDRGGGYIGYKLRFNPFGEVFHYDNGESVVSLCWCKLPTISRPYRYRGQDGAINYEG
jgi:hypothetical protein